MDEKLKTKTKRNMTGPLLNQWIQAKKFTLTKNNMGIKLGSGSSHTVLLQ